MKTLSTDDAAWIRAHVWTQDMRAGHRTTPDASHTCACQSGTSLHCLHGRHNKCGRGTPLRSWETIICGPDGKSPLRFAEPFEHVTDTSATGPQREQAALVWLADRVCRWLCPCDCHTAPAPPRQLDLFGAPA